MEPRAFFFECNSKTYLDCVEKEIFGSNSQWPLEIIEGDYCLLHHYEIGGLLGLWKATSNGGRNLVSNIWKGKFPFQVRVKLVLPRIVEVPKGMLEKFGVDPTTGRFDNNFDKNVAEDIVRFFLDSTK